MNRLNVLKFNPMKLSDLRSKLIILTLVFPFTAFSQKDFCGHFNKTKQIMEEGFASAKGTKILETTKDYTSMLITTKKWASKYLFPEALTADITEILRVAPDPRNAGHNIYISFNFAKNVTKAAAEAIFVKIRENIKVCLPLNWKIEERSGNTYARYSLMDGNNYDLSPHKITLQFSKMDGAGDRFTADLVFDTAVK